MLPGCAIGAAGWRTVGARRPGVPPVNLLALLAAAGRVAQRARRAVPHGTDDLVHPPAAWGHERLGAGAEHRGQAVGAQPRMLADAAVVEDCQLVARIAVATVGDPFGILGVAETGPRVAAVAPGLDRRLAAAAQRQLRRRAALGTEVVGQPRHVGHEVWPIVRRLD